MSVVSDLKLRRALTRVCHGTGPVGGRWWARRGFSRSGPAQGSDGMSTGLNLAMISSGVDGGFLAFLPMADVFCCQ